MRATELREALVRHLEWWGLRRFETDAAYFQWQRATLSSQDLAALGRLAELKRAVGADPAAEVAFYDQAAAPHILPILYSQRFDYYLAVGPRVAERITGAKSVLDFGCGPGLLTTFYARQYPDIAFTGVDRSGASIAVARAQAERIGLGNLRFEVLDIEREPDAGTYDLLVATHALLQAEQDPGVPSRSWQTLERALDPAAQTAFESRTGLGPRLDRLFGLLPPQGRAILFEKTRTLARRVPFQRALAVRGFTLLEDPIPLRYLLVEEITEDGPLYTIGRAAPNTVRGRLRVWNEAPESVEGQDLYRCQGRAASAVWERLPVRVPAWEGRWSAPGLGQIRVEAGRCLAFCEYLYVTINDEGRGILVRPYHERTSLEAGFRRALGGPRRESARLPSLLEDTWPSSAPPEDPQQTPLYENHSLAAIEVWAALQDRVVRKEATFDEPGGEQRHIELGEARGLTYLYWATTFDQRQIVIVERSRTALLEQYYAELLSGQHIP